METRLSNKMDSSQKNIRVMHYIGEFLNLDLASFGSVAEFLALIEALREGLMTVDDYFAVPDFHINMLFLSKLECHPDWTEWAKKMMRDKRINAIDPAKQMKFHELSQLAMEHEKYLQNKTPINSESTVSEHISNRVDRPSRSKPLGLTQEETNTYVLRQMRKTAEKQRLASHNNHRIEQGSHLTNEGISPSPRPTKPGQNHNPVHSRVSPPTNVNGVSGHSKKPSQEEINDFVVRQMRKEQERKMRARSRSHPDLRKTQSAPSNRSSKSTPLPVRQDKPIQQPQNLMTDLASRKCQSCGEMKHPGEPCRSAIVVTADIPRKTFVSKRMDIRTKVAEKTPLFRTKFALV